MPFFHYSNEYLTGVLDVSDYFFCCIIEAATRQEALEWGNRIATEYNQRYGLLPRGNRLDPREVPHNASVFSWSSRRDTTGFLYCKAGDMPDFAAWRNDRV
jgi:hypothetical protein